MNPEASAATGPPRQARVKPPMLPLWLGAVAVLVIAAYGPLWAATRDPQIDVFPGAPRSSRSPSSASE